MTEKRWKEAQVERRWEDWVSLMTRRRTAGVLLKRPCSQSVSMYRNIPAHVTDYSNMMWRMNGPILNYRSLLFPLWVREVDLSYRNTVLHHLCVRNAPAACSGQQWRMIKVTHDSMPFKILINKESSSLVRQEDFTTTLQWLSLK